jgi:hypothetical protein
LNMDIAKPEMISLNYDKIVNILNINDKHLLPPIWGDRGV